MAPFPRALLCVLLLPVAAWAAEAQWMLPGVEPAPNQWFAYRGSFELDAVPERAVATIACDSKYWLWVNGRMAVREGQLKRGPTPDSTYADTVDLAPWLKPGRNTVAILQLFFGKHGFSHNDSGSPGLFFDLDAGGARLAGGSDWRVRHCVEYGKSDGPGPNYRLPEASVEHDARRAIDGWEQPGFDDSGWRAPLTAGGRGAAPWGPLETRPVPQWKDGGVREYARVERIDLHNGTWQYVARLPYNAQFHPVIEVDAPAGEWIEFETSATRPVGRATVRGSYITRAGRQTYEHLPWLSGDEILFEAPYSVDVIALRFRETGYDTDTVGRWESDDPELDELWRRAHRTLYVNMRDTYMDCPDRERAQWWGDVVVQLGQNLHLFDYDSGQLLIRKGILELARWQRADGSIYSPVPSGLPGPGGADRDGSYDRELPYQMLASVGWYGFWRYFFFTGDSETLGRVYPHVKRYLDLWQLDEHGLTVPRVPERRAWIWVDWGRHKDTRVLASCWHHLALRAAVEMARVAGAGDDIPSYRERMAAIESAFHETFWQGDHYRGSLPAGEIDDRANAMAVVAGLAPETVYPQIRDVLMEHRHASPYMEKYVEEALFLMGRPDDALTRMKERYRVMLDLPISTLREHFHPTRGTDNHAWSGGPLTLMAEQVAGITPTSFGYREYRVRPSPAGPDRIETTVSTPHGPVSLQLVREGGSLTITLDPPEGCTGAVHVPNHDDGLAKIEVNGRTAWRPDGPVPHPDVEWAGRADGHEVFTGITGPVTLRAVAR